MIHLLRKGQIFKCKLFNKLVGHKTSENGEPCMDFNELFYNPEAKIETLKWTQYGEDGWQRSRELTLDPYCPKDYSDEQFIVAEVASDYSYFGDRYRRDCHHIIAKECVKPNSEMVVVQFHQSGQSRYPIIQTKDIELVAGPEDKRVQLKMVWEEY